jgi:hypothetical protein
VRQAALDAVLWANAGALRSLRLHDSRHRLGLEDVERILAAGGAALTHLSADVFVWLPCPRQARTPHRCRATRLSWWRA